MLPNPPPRTQRQSLVAVLLAAVWLVACGGSKPPEDNERPKPKRPPAPPPEAAAEGAGELVGGWIVLGENPKWKPVKPLMEAYAKLEIGALHNPMRPTLVDFVERPMAPERPIDAPVATTTSPTSCVDPKNPATTATLTNYTLFMLVTGVAQPKAVLAMRTGEQISVVRGDRLGSECGVVQAITQYELVVSIPGEPERVMSLEPPLNPVEKLDAETQGNGKKPEL